MIDSRIALRTLRVPLSVLAVALALAGCANSDGLNTQGRTLPADALHSERSLQGVQLSAAAWPRQDWWSALGDQQLNALIAEALSDSPDLQAANARSHQAYAAASSADADRMPTVDGSAGVTRSRLSRNQDPLGEGGRYGTLRSLAVDASYDFDLWGGQRDTWEAALGRARAAEVDEQASRLTLASDVARAYSNLARAYVVRDLAEEDLKRTRQLLDLGSRRLKSGIDSEYQYQQTESLAASSEETLLDARKNLRSAGIALAVLLGKGPDRAADVQRPRVLKPAVVALPPQLPAELLGRRPDLVAARWRVEAAGKDIAASKTRFYPNLNLSASAGVESLLGDALFGAPSRFFNVGPTLSLPLFDGGRRRADLDARDADYDLAVAQYNKTLVQALNDVSDYVGQLRDLEGQVAARQHATDVIQRSYDTVLQRYSAGIGNYLDVLSVEQQLLDSQRQLADLNANRIDLSIRLMQALGGGFDGSANPASTTQSAAVAASPTH